MKPWKAAILGVIVGLLMIAAAKCFAADQFPALPRAVPAVFYANPQTYSIWSDKGLLLFAGIREICVTTRDFTSGLFFVDQGQPKVLNLRPGEAVIISADPQISVPKKVGPRK